MDKKEALLYLSDIDKQLAAEGATGELYIVGGAALMLAYNNRRTTTDIDGWYCPRDEIERFSSSTAKKYGLPNNWLNNAVAFLGFDFDKDINRKSIPIGDNLTVSVASPEFLLYMKVNSIRRSSQDVEDIKNLCSILGLVTEADINSALAPFGGVQGSAELYIEDIVSEMKK